MQTKRIFIVDAMALAFRSFHAISRPLTTSSGMPTQAIYGSLMFLFNLIEKEKPDYLLIASDCSAPTFRHEIYDGYKANRTEMPEDLAVQIPYLYKAFSSLGCPVLKQEGFEADDLIGSIVHQWNRDDLHCYIVSGDKDFLQLIGPNVFLYSPKKGGNVQMTDIEGVKTKFGVGPEHVIDILALIGDNADNVPGVPGIGEKGAAKLIQSFGNLESIYQNLDSIKNKRQHTGLIENKEQAFLSRTLVTIKTDVPIKVDLKDCLCEPVIALGNRTLLELTQELEFKTLSQRVEGYLSKTTEVAGSAKDLTNSKRTNCNYLLISDQSDLDKISQLIQKSEMICVDTETTGLDINIDQPIGVSLSWEEGQAAYIPLHEKHCGQLDINLSMKFLKSVLTRSDLLKVGHNLKFDVQMLKNIGIEISGPIADTMIASHLVNNSERSHSLDACCLRYLNYEKIPTSKVLGSSESMLEADLELLSNYACEDADYTLRLYEVLYPQLREQNQTSVFSEIEMPLIPILAEMEQTGVFVDDEQLISLSERLSVKIDELTKTIYEMAEEEFNIRSTKQLQYILFEKLKIHDELGITKIKKTKTGYSTDNSVLEQLAAHPLIQCLLEYRQVTKIKSTYVDTLPKLIKTKTGRIHTSFHQTGTATGRLSSSDPNMQNIPIRTELGKEIRSAFKAPDDSTVIISADYSQVELRILAVLSGDESLKNAFENQLDIHTATAAKVFAIDPKLVSSDQRSQAKAINFGIIYGMGPQRLAKETGVSIKQAKDFIDKYFQSYPKIKSYIDEAFTFAKENSYTQTINGRRRLLPEIHSTNPMQLANAKNIAVNSPVQGSAADLIKIAMIKLQNELNRSELNVKMVLQVHDELVFECQRSDLEPAMNLIQDVMEHAMDLSVPLKVDVGSGNNWLEAH